MRLERLTSTELRLTLSDDDLMALMAATRSMLEPGSSELTQVTRARAEALVKEYDAQIGEASTRYPGTRPAVLRLDPPAAEYAGADFDPF